MARVNGRNLSLVIGGLDVACVSSSVVFDNEDPDADLVTFADITSGNDRRWFFIVTAWQDYAPGTFWTLLWQTPAFTPIAYTFKPYANIGAASASQPWFTGSATLDQPPPLGGDAATTWAFQTRLTCTARPTRAVT